MEVDELAPYIDQLSARELEELYASLADYDEVPVSIDEFLDSPMFLGGYFNGQVFPYWRKVLRDIYPSPFISPYWLIAFRGCIGQGKTQIACTGMLYDLYRLNCLAHPQEAHGLLPSTRILFAIFNVTLSLTQDVIWDRVSQMMANSPYFSKLVYNAQQRKRKGEAMFPKNIDFFMGSRVGHTLGKAVFEGIMSEANFEMVENQVYETFNSLLRRMESRFMAPGGGIPGKLWIDSSETDKFSVVNKIVDGYRGKPGVYVSQAALWEVQPHRYGTQRFWVYKGSDVRKAEVLKDEHDPLITKEPDNCIQVPVEHKDAFEADINASLRDLAGVAVTSNYKLFRLKDKLHKAATISPLFPETVTLDFDDENDQIINYALVSSYFSSPLNKNMPRHIHIDIALTGDRLGIGASYVSNFKERKSRDPFTFQEVSESVPEVITEWAMGIEPTPGKQIPLYKIRLFISQLQSAGYPIGWVTCDGFQSADMIQGFIKMGIEASLISVDKTTVPYMSMRSAIYEGRHFFPQSKLLLRECEELEVSTDGKKVDHPEHNSNSDTRGSKDVSDAVCGSFYGAELNAHKAKIFLMAQYEADKAQYGAQGIRDMFWGNQG